MAAARSRDLGAELQGLATDLFTIEVNTIVRANMRVRRVSSVDELLRDVLREYREALRPEDAGATEPAAPGEPGKEAFARLAARAKEALASDPEGGRDRPILQRIRDNAEAIQGILAGWKPGEDLPAGAFLALRKMWEIGTEEIAMQTVVHVNGDVVTRIQPKYAGAAGQELVAIHNAAVVTSTRFWQSLVDTLGAFLEGVGRLFFGRSR